MKEQKIYDRVRELGREPLPHAAIVVTRAPETVPLAVAEFFTKTNRYRALVVCADAIALLPLDDIWGLKRSGSYRVIDREDIRATGVSLADAGMTRRITIDLPDEELVLNAQHESTSSLRTSGMWGAWHAENLPRVLELIEEMGAQRGRRAADAAEPACDAAKGVR